MDRQVELRTAQMLRSTQSRMRKTLEEVWLTLYWEPKINPEADRVGLVLEQAGDPPTPVALLPDGRIVTVRERAIKDVDLTRFTFLALKAESLVRQERERQHQELISDTQGRIIQWKPGQHLFGFYHSQWNDYSASDGFVSRSYSSVPVWVKEGRLYCPTHRDLRLVLAHAPSQGDSPRYASCPKDYHYQVYSGC